LNDLKYYAIKIHNREDYKTGIKETNIYNKLKAYKSKHLMTILRTFDHATDDGVHHCCIMDLMACSLYKLIKTKEYKNGIPFNIVMRCVHQIVHGLYDLHKNKTIHGDIKPENILVSGISNDHKKLFDTLNIDALILDNVKKSKEGNKTIKKNAQPNKNEPLCIKGCSVIQTDIKNIIKNDTVRKNIISDIKKRLKMCNNDIDKQHMTMSDSETNYSSSTEEYRSYSISSCKSSNSERSYDSRSYDDIEPVQTDNIYVRITDMGSCVLATSSHKKEINCTPYYRSPEMLMNMEYNDTCDMWALGCAIYELLTGNILFNPDDYEGNTKRHHLYLIVKKLGIVPKTIMETCQNKDVFFTHDLKRLKGYKNIDFSQPLANDLHQICQQNNVDIETETYFIDFMSKIFVYDPANRLCSGNALKHPIFNKNY
jgi:serine/threonine-protein kinase SRPK3